MNTVQDETTMESGDFDSTKLAASVRGEVSTSLLPQTVKDKLVSLSDADIAAALSDAVEECADFAGYYRDAVLLVQQNRDEYHYMVSTATVQNLLSRAEMPQNTCTHCGAEVWLCGSQTVDGVELGIYVDETDGDGCAENLAGHAVAVSA